jgi:hypothetical protein
MAGDTLVVWLFPSGQHGKAQYGDRATMVSTRDLAGDLTLEQYNLKPNGYGQQVNKER